MGSRADGQAMERASREIASSLGVTLRRRYRRARVVAPLRAIDQMLDDLERLNLVGRRRVPLEWGGRLAKLAISLPAEFREVPEMRTNVATGRLMDSLYEIQDTLLDIKMGAIRQELREFDSVEFGSVEIDLPDGNLDVA